MGENDREQKQLTKENRSEQGEPLKKPDSSQQADPFQEQGGLVLSLLDGASAQVPIIAPELEPRKRVAADPDRPLEERLEAFEDIIDSEIGDTALSRSRNIEREVGLRQLYLKFEGGNPTGAQKDRIAFAQAMDAMRRGFDAITVATCGNYGAARAALRHLHSSGIPYQASSGDHELRSGNYTRGRRLRNGSAGLSTKGPIR
jgi:hypothetical protein